MAFGATTSLEDAIRLALPGAYNFEIPKTIRRINSLKAKRVCLQFPEGLLCWAESIALIIETFAESVEDVFIIADVTYGACCIDDLKARALKADFLVHYAHSCLIPIDAVGIPCLYVFVEIELDSEHLGFTIRSIAAHHVTMKFEMMEEERELAGSNEAKFHKLALAGATTGHDSPVKIKAALLSTIQFAAATQLARYKVCSGNGPAIPGCQVEVISPQCLPLMPGETLGCTSPVIPADTDFCLFVADGRFHLESAMMHNPHIEYFYRYDPFLKKVFSETLDREGLMQIRHAAVEEALGSVTDVVFLYSALGRQGSMGLMEHLEKSLREVVTRGSSRIRVTKLAVGELSARTLKTIITGDDDFSPDGAGGGGAGRRSYVFVNVGCPRLSLDWGTQFADAPLLTTYEFMVAINGLQSRSAAAATSKLYGPKHPMDYFAANGGDWTNYPKSGRHRNGSLAASGGDAGLGGDAKKTKAQLLKEKWLARKVQMQNV